MEPNSLIRKALPLALAPIFFLTTSYELITDYHFVNKKHPVHFSGEFRNVGKAKFYTHPVKGTHADYQDAHSYLYYSHYLTPDNSLTWKLGYSYLNFNWLKNPRFKENNYHFANASVGWVSTSLTGWRWIVSTAVSVDPETFNFGKSAVYFGTLWGRYHFSDTIGMHVGSYGYYGVRKGYLLPIVGIDWRASQSWQIIAIFPVNLSVQYHFNKHWTTSLEVASFGRPYRFPIRVHGGIGRFRDGIFSVYSNGVELDLRFNAGAVGGAKCCASFGGGWNWGGWILIKDHDNNHGKYYKFEGAPYIQSQISFTL